MSDCHRGYLGCDNCGYKYRDLIGSIHRCIDANRFEDADRLVDQLWQTTLQDAKYLKKYYKFQRLSAAEHIISIKLAIRDKDIKSIHKLVDEYWHNLCSGNWPKKEIPIPKDEPKTEEPKSKKGIAVFSAIIVLFFMIMINISHYPVKGDSRSNSVPVNFQDDGKKDDDKVYTKREDIPFPKTGQFYIDWCYTDKKDVWRVAIFTDEAGSGIQLIKISAKIFEDNYGFYDYMHDHIVYGNFVYSIADRAVGYIPRGKVIGKPVLNSENWLSVEYFKFVDVELESGKKKRIFVSPELFDELKDSDKLLPKKITIPVELSKDEARNRKGWIVKIHSARGDFSMFIPLDGGERPFTCILKKDDFFFLNTDFYGDSPEPKIAKDFGICPKGELAEKYATLKRPINLEDLRDYFVAVKANNGKYQRYKVDKEFYDLVKVGDNLPLGEEKKEKKEPVRQDF